MPKSVCKVCGKNSESDYCFHHKPKQLQQRVVSTSSKKGGVGKPTQLKTFYFSIWNNRKHVCENCGVKLGKEPRTYMFDHLLEKSKHPELTFVEDNIMLVCLECHDNKTRGFLSEKMIDLIEKLKTKYLVIDR